MTLQIPDKRIQKNIENSTLELNSLINLLKAYLDLSGSSDGLYTIQKYMKTNISLLARSLNVEITENDFLI